MKDYTTRLEIQKRFILSYEIKEDKILIKYASGKIYETIYNKEVEKKILKRMKEQVLFPGSKDFYLDKIKDLFLSWVAYIMCMIYVLLVFFNGFIDIALCLGFICTGVKILIDIHSKKMVKDYEKNLLFVRNMKLFQNGINKDMGMYLDLNKKSNDIINEIIEKREKQKDLGEEYSILREPTINTIDKISPKLIENIYELLEKNEEFSKYYNSDNVYKRIKKK